MHLNAIPDADCLLVTSRATLAPVADGDAEGLWPHVSNPAITDFLAWRPHADIAETLAMIAALRQARVEDRGIHWCLRVGGKIVGLVSLIDVRRSHREWTLERAELAYWLAPEAQGKGLATEACRAVLAFGFGAMGLHKIIVAHASDNPASGAVAARLGFRHRGHERHAFQKHGVWHDMEHYELLADDLGRGGGA